ncbi:O-antigen ligase family protein [Ornithinimicrobium cavernae]|uniref:O-antigen ligase family protein n=1 Tax=Ornithinimicrobium cavernae TaxID=2666047 RepID=UPI000D69209B|nr:O-antigen ligase family protein [Ornithinimicrobium cavernae]
MRSPTDERLLHLPTWPITALLVGFPVWWVLGIGTLAWPLAALVMAAYLARVGDVHVPRGTGLWLLFLVWMSFSVLQLESLTSVVGFGYRWALYVACTVIFVYLYNLRVPDVSEFLLRRLTVFFAVVVAGGFLGLLLPTLTVRTPLSYLLPAGLLSNDLVREIVIVGTTQFNPDAWTYRDPRPSAPFQYTNNWGNAYSILLPLVVTYLFKLRGTRAFMPVIMLAAASVIPAFLTLNRGMFLGLGVAALVVALRHALHGNGRALLGVVAASAIGLLLFRVLPVTERLDTRLESSGTNESRLTVYTETIAETIRSPWFGYGAPRPAEASGVPPLGTQGQLWMVMFSHGFVGVALFVAWFIVLIVRTFRRATLLGITYNAVLVVALVEIFYYGFLVQGLVLTMMVAAVALRGVETAREDASLRAETLDVHASGGGRSRSAQHISAATRPQGASGRMSDP